MVSVQKKSEMISLCKIASRQKGSNATTKEQLARTHMYNPKQNDAQTQYSVLGTMSAAT